MIHIRSLPLARALFLVSVLLLTATMTPPSLHASVHRAPEREADRGLLDTGFDSARSRPAQSSPSPLLTNRPSAQLTQAATPVVDGLLDASYQFVGRTDPGADAPGNLYRYAGTSNCFYAFVVDRAFNDNVYGDKDAHAAYLRLDGWVNGGGKVIDHTYGKLKGSDEAQFSISYPGGSLNNLTLDYIENDSPPFVSGETDNNSPINASATSLGWNLNSPGSGWTSTTQSPPYNWNDTPGRYWEWHMIYEFSIPRSQMNGACGDVTLAGAHNSPSKFKSDLGQIGDYVWRDIDGEGDQDEANAGIPGVTVNLYQGTTLVRTTQTEPGTSGYYIFSNLPAGTYTVDVVESTLPPNSVLTTNNEPFTHNLGSGEIFLGADFGYNDLISTLEITKDASSPIVPVGGEVTFTIRVTNIGLTTITSLPLSDLYDTTKLDFISATPAPDSATDDGVLNWSDLTQGGAGGFGQDLAPGASFEVSVRFGSGITAASAQARYLETTVAGTGTESPWIDPFQVSAPAIEECECEGGLTRLSFTYRAPSGYPSQVRLQILTKGNFVGSGNKTIQGVVDGQTLIVEKESGDSKLDSNTKIAIVNPNSGNSLQTAEVHTSCSQPIYTGLLFGSPSAFEVRQFTPRNGFKSSCQLGSIGDLVFEDRNGSASFTGGEPGINGVTVELYGGSCSALPATPLSTKVTSAGTSDNGANAGFYLFDNLPTGHYCVNVKESTVPLGLSLTTANDPLAVTLDQEGTNFRDADFGYLQTGQSSIGDRVFYDLDASGLPDGGSEPGINGVSVHLHQGNCPGAGTPLRSAVTSGNGGYLFSNLPAGPYCVEVDESTLPPDLTLTTGAEPIFKNLGTVENYRLADFGYRATCPGGTPNFAVVDGAVSDAGRPPERVSDSACVFIANYVLTKENISDPTLVGVRQGDDVVFQVRVLNNGDVPLVLVPMRDTFDPTYLLYDTSSLAPNVSAAQGGNTVEWNDLTGANPTGFGRRLPPGDEFSITLNFIGIQDTTELPGEVTINTVGIFTPQADPDGDGNPPFYPLPDRQATAPAKVLAPTSVDLKLGTAHYASGGVELRWETVSEVNLLGFRLYRKEAGSEPLLLTADPILAEKSGQASGDAYHYLDTQVQLNQTYLYELEMLYADGGSSRSMLGVVTSMPSLYFPMIRVD